MTFTYDNAVKIIADISLDGDFEAWFAEIWHLIERDRCNVCQTRLEIIRFYKLVYDLCALYASFANVWYGFDTDEYLIYLDIDFKPILDRDTIDEDGDGYAKDLVYLLVNEGGYGEAARFLSVQGTDVVFASLYFALGCEDFSIDMDFDDVFDSILNEVDVDKMKAYEWLKEILG